MFKKILQRPYVLIACLLLARVAHRATAQEPAPLPLPPAPAVTATKSVVKNNDEGRKVQGKQDESETDVGKAEESKTGEDNLDKDKKGEQQVQKTLPKVKLSAISGKTPYYVDKGVTMIPIRPICDFLGLEITYRAGLISIFGTLPSSAGVQIDQTQKGDGNPAPASENIAQANSTIFVNFRDGSRVAQIIEGANNRTSTLDLAPETRLGVTFVPLRFLSVAFNAKVTFNARSGLIIVQSGDHIGYLRQPDQCGKDVKKTVNLTVANRVGRAFTLELKGPCDFRIELGRLQKVVAKLPAGLYEYTAVSEGVYPRHGKRWFREGATVNWGFGG